MDSDSTRALPIPSGLPIHSRDLKSGSSSPNDTICRLVTSSRLFSAPSFVSDQKWTFFYLSSIPSQSLGTTSYRRPPRRRGVRSEGEIRGPQRKKRWRRHPYDSGRRHRPPVLEPRRGGEDSFVSIWCLA